MQRDVLGEVRIAPDAPLGTRPWQLWTAQGATPALRFMVGDLPEVVEQEIDGDPVPDDCFAVFRQMESSITVK